MMPEKIQNLRRAIRKNDQFERANHRVWLPNGECMVVDGKTLKQLYERRDGIGTVMMYDGKGVLTNKGRNQALGKNISEWLNVYGDKHELYITLRKKPACKRRANE